jgi:hypothetical protein
MLRCSEQRAYAIPAAAQLHEICVVSAPLLSRGTRLLLSLPSADAFRDAGFGDDGHVSIDAAALSQVLTNLAHNSARFTSGEDTFVCLSCRILPHEAHSERVAAARAAVRERRYNSGGTRARTCALLCSRPVVAPPARAAIGRRCCWSAGWSACWSCRSTWSIWLCDWCWRWCQRCTAGRV